MSLKFLVPWIVAVSASVSALPARASAADFEILPDSRHPMVQTYGLFIDEQSMLIYRGAGKAWGALGGTLALLEAKDWALRPQLVAHGSANASYRVNSKGDTLLTDTIDARVGLWVELELDPQSRMLVGWEHQSGHISDNIEDLELIGPNLGNEVLMIRYARDVIPELRVGATLKPYLGSEPGMKTFAADQFADWFFAGIPADRHRFKPYVSMGFEEYGHDRVELTFHAQAGLMAGTRWSPGPAVSFRPVIGYYTGVDPRLKYAQFYSRRASFGYVGVMLDL